MKMWLWILNILQTIWDVIIFIWKKKNQIFELTLQIDELKVSIEKLRSEIRLATEDKTITKEEAEALFSSCYGILEKISSAEQKIKEILKKE